MFRFFSTILTLTIIALLNAALFADVSTRDMDKEAQRHFENKEYNQAIIIWRDILEQDPNNELINQKIERVYDVQQRKYLFIQRAKRSLRRSFNDVDGDYNNKWRLAKDAIKNYSSARDIEPGNPEILALGDEIMYLREQMNERERVAKLSIELQRRSAAMREEAQREMRNKNFPAALGIWRSLLKLAPADQVALEGEASCILAIENRLVFETMQGFIDNGKRLFEAKDYTGAKFQFLQALSINDRNREVRRYIRDIDEELEKLSNYEQRRIQAESAYRAGINNVTKGDFDQAFDDFTQCLSLVDNYKDAKERLANIETLRKQADERSRRERFLAAEKAFVEGYTLFTSGEYRAAIPHFEKVLSLDPGNRQAQELLRRSTAALIQLEEEVVDKYSPYYDIVNSLIVSGNAFLAQRDYAASKKKWEQILNLFPKNKIAMESLLKCNALSDMPAFMELAKQVCLSAEGDMRANDYKRALEKFELIHSINPNYPDINKMIARARDGMGRGRAGNLTAADRQAISVRLQNAVAFYQQGGEENMRKALAEYRWIIERDPDHMQANIGMNRIEAQLRLGQPDNRAQAARFTPEQRQLINRYYNSGINYYANNNFQKAIEEWRKVLAIDPNHTRAKNNIKKTIAILSRAEG